MDEPIICCRWGKGISYFAKTPARDLEDKLDNAILLDDKDEFLKLIKYPEFRDCFITVGCILEKDASQIAMAVLNGETRGLIYGEYEYDTGGQPVIKNGWTPLHVASVTASPGLVKRLIERGDPVDVTYDHDYLGLKHPTPLDLALQVIHPGYENSRFTSNDRRHWTPRSSIFELFIDVCEYKRCYLEVIRLLVQNTKDKERVRKAFFDYANEGKLVQLVALFLAAPELFLSSSHEGDGLSSIDAVYLNLNSLDKRTDIQDGLSLLLDVFYSVGHMLIAFVRIDDPRGVWMNSYADRRKIGFFLREAARTKLGISSHDDYLLSFFKPVSDVYEPPSSDQSKVDTSITNSQLVSPLKIKRKDSDIDIIDINFVNRETPSMNRHEEAYLRKAIEKKLSKMPSICTLFEKGERPRFSSPSARSIKHMGALSFCTEATNAKCRLNFKLNPGNGWKSRVIYPTKLESFSSAVRLSHIPIIAKRLIK